MANVRFIKTTKEKHLKRETYDPNALYFCEDTQEIYKGQYPYTEGIKVIPTKADLPSCPCAADGVVYFVAETKSGYMMSPDRTEWLQTIYAPVTDAYTIPEEEMYTTVTTVGAVRDIEKKIYERIDEVASGGGLSNLTPVDGTIKITDTSDGGKSIGVAIAPIAGNILKAVDGGLFVPEISVKISDNAHGLVAVNGALTINLVTKDSDGAMSKEDKAFLDELKELNISSEYVTKNEIQDVKESVAQIEQSYVWAEM